MMAAKPIKTKRQVQRPPRLGDAMRLDGDDAVVLGQIADYYHEKFKATPAAHEYVARRGLESREIADHFRLGYSDQSLSAVLPQKDTKLGHEVRERLTRLGIMSGGRERFLGCVVVPWFDGQRAVAGMYGRRISPPASKTTPVHYELPGGRGIFNEAGLAVSKDVVLARSIIDALTWWCAGFANVTAARELTPELIAALAQHGTERVLIAWPGCKEPDDPAIKIGERLHGHGVVPYRVELPTGMDANDYARKFAPSARSLALLVRKARPMVEGAAAIVVPAALVEGPLVDRSLAETRPSAFAPSVPAMVPSSAPTADASPNAAVTETTGDEVVMQFESRRYRVRGLKKNLSYDVLKVNLLVARGDLYFVDSLDLYSAKHRASFVKQAAAEIAVDEGLVKKELGQILMRLEVLQHERIAGALAPRDEAPKMSPAEHNDALEFLRDPKLLDRVLADFDRCGIVGEQTNKLVAYLAAISRKLDDPLAVVVQSSSSAGKSSLMDAVLGFVPPEDVVKFSAMTPQSLFYIGETNLAHKVLAIAEEAGADRAAYALKLLQSERELTIATTGRDPLSGKMVTEAYRVKGPTALFLTTTRVDLDDELANRAIVLAVSEDRSQTRAVHRAQRARETLDGLMHRRSKDRLVRLHQNAQRLLQPMAVVNPFAEALTFMDHGPRARRDHAKYLALIRAIAFVHQYQRPVRSAEIDGATVEYIEVALADIEVANRLVHEVLGRAIDDLTPQTRALLGHLDQMAIEAAAAGVARAEFRFGRREVQSFTGWSYDAVRVHLQRLRERELVVLHNGGRGERHRYELVFDGREGGGHRPVLAGLVDPSALRPTPHASTLDDVGAGFGGALGPVGVGLGAESSAPEGRDDAKLRDSMSERPAKGHTTRHRRAAIGSGAAANGVRR